MDVRVTELSEVDDDLAALDGVTFEFRVRREQFSFKIPVAEIERPALPGCIDVKYCRSSPLSTAARLMDRPGWDCRQVQARM